MEELVKYAHFHFQSEGNILYKHGYPEQLLRPGKSELALNYSYSRDAYEVRVVREDTIFPAKNVAERRMGTRY